MTELAAMMIQGTGKLMKTVTEKVMVAGIVTKASDMILGLESLLAGAVQMVALATGMMVSLKVQVPEVAETAVNWW